MSGNKQIGENPVVSVLRTISKQLEYTNKLLGRLAPTVPTTTTTTTV